jgi:hypothetical protein
MIYSLYCYIVIVIKKLKLILSIFENQFHIGYAYGIGERNLNKFRYIRNPKNGYYADPFIAKYRGELFIFCEFYNYESNKGRIDVFKLDSNQCAIYVGCCIEEEFHLSFPFIVQIENEHYLIPETKSLNSVNLYKCISWPLIWVKQTELIKSGSYVDSIVLYYGNKWWLFTTKSCLPGLNSQSELYLYYSESLSTSHWKPHKLNPILIDNYYGRNSGYFFDGENIFRCSQAHKKGLYGSEINFHKIIKLSEDFYYEEKNDQLLISNCHTYDSKFGLTVVDSRLQVFKFRK